MKFNPERRAACAVAGEMALLSVSGSPNVFAFDGRKDAPRIIDWNATTKEFLRPCLDVLLAPLQEGANTGGATCRSLPHLPVKAVNG